MNEKNEKVAIDPVAQGPNSSISSPLQPPVIRPDDTVTLITLTSGQMATVLGTTTELKEKFRKHQMAFLETPESFTPWVTLDAIKAPNETVELDVIPSHISTMQSGPTHRDYWHEIKSQELRARAQGARGGHLGRSQ